MNAPITTDSMSDTNNINVISENSYEFSKESKRKRLAEIALSVDQYMSTRPPLPLSYLVINTFDDEVEIEGLFSNNEAATAYITRLAVNMSVHLYPERVEECNGVMNEESFYEFVDEFIAKNYKKIILTHLDVSKPVYQIVDQDDNYLYDEPTEYLTNSVAKWKSNYPPDQLSSDPEFLEDCTIEIDPAIPKLLTSTYY